MGITNGNGNKTRLNLGSGMAMNDWEWEGMGLKKTFPHTSSFQRKTSWRSQRVTTGVGISLRPAHQRLRVSRRRTRYSVLRTASDEFEFRVLRYQLDHVGIAVNLLR